MVGLDVLNQPRNSAVKAPGRGKYPRLNPSRVRFRNSKKKMRGANSTGYLEKCGNLAATPTTPATHQHPPIGRVARPTAIPYYLGTDIARFLSRRDNFQEDY